MSFIVKSFSSIFIVLFITGCFPLRMGIDEVDDNYYYEYDGESEDFGEEDPSVDGDDSYEPNDDFVDATLITAGADNSQEHTIFGEGDIDYFYFSATASSEYRITLSDIKGFEPEISLYDTDNLTILEMKNTGTFTGEYDFFGWDKDRNYLDNEKYSIIFTADETTNYYFCIKDIFDAHSRGSYTLTLREYVTVGDGTDSLVAIADPSEFRINVTWDAISGVEGYYLYRTTTAQDLANPVYSDFSLLATVEGENTTTYHDTGIQPETTYYYYAKGFYGDSTGGETNVDDATFEWATFKSGKDIIDASQGVPELVRVTFKEKYANANIVRYDVYRSEDEGTPVYEGPLGSFDTSDAIGSTFDDTTVTLDQYYFYCVRIVIMIDGVEVESDYSWFDSGLGVTP